MCCVHERSVQGWPKCDISTRVCIVVQKHGPTTGPSAHPVQPAANHIWSEVVRNQDTPSRVSVMVTIPRFNAKLVQSFTELLLSYPMALYTTLEYFWRKK